MGVGTLVGIVVGAIVARAGTGTRSGATNTKLTFAGTLNDAQGMPLAGMHALTFTFKNGARTCPVQVTGVAGGPFTAGVETAPCGDLFDGADVTVSIAVDGNTMVTDQLVSPTGYSKYSDKAANAAVTPATADDAGACPVGKILTAASGGAFTCVDPPTTGLTVGTYVGSTTATTNASFASGGEVGIRAGALICSAQFANSHMCTSDEIYRSVANGTVSAANPISAAAWIWAPAWNSPMATTSSPNDGLSDTCGAYTYPTGDHKWTGTLVQTNTLAETAKFGVRILGGASALCNFVKPIACCR
jgi:hypothetical protein